MPWGLLAWGLSWLAQAVLFHNTNYHSHSTTVAHWDLARGGLRGYAGAGNRYHGLGGGYRPALGAAFVPRPPNDRYPGGGHNPGPAQASVIPRPPNHEQEFVPRPANGYARPGGGYNVALGHEFVPRPPSRDSEYGRVGRSSRDYQGLGDARGPQQSYLSSTAHRPPRDERALSARLQASSFGQGYSPKSGGRGIPEVRSNGFHPFGSAHRSVSYPAGGHAPKMKGEKGSSRHSGGGGHSGGRSSGKHHH